MNNTSSIYGAFNARWLSPQEIARSFVPTTHFKALVKLQHSLLMGPRGCGKTTLLKMLTRPAQTIWYRERVQMSPELAEYPSPDFEAIYVPSDIRWSAELDSVVSQLKGSESLAQVVQRASVGISALMEATRAFEEVLYDEEQPSDKLIKALITHFKLGPTIPSFGEVRLKLLSWSEELHALITAGDHQGLKKKTESLPAALTGHAMDALARACTIFAEFGAPRTPKKWALCFDELEIAPRWLQSELLQSLRSVDQTLLLKLTWSPILPTDIAAHQERQHDYATIRMWHPHAAEARPFAQQFSTRLLRERLTDSKVTPSDVFGVSPFAQDDSGGNRDPYGEGSEAWQTFVSLASKDASFRRYLVEQAINPSNPVAATVRVRDEVLRKVKPIALVRDAYLREGGVSALRRSRKSAPLYFGEDAIYAMSEGNPRMLAGLLNELLDAETKPLATGSWKVRPEVQARVLYAASQRTFTGIRTYPISAGSKSASLSKIVSAMGEYLRGELVGPEFRADPVGSFSVDQDVAEDVLEAIKIGLLIGAFVYVGSSFADVPVSVLGARIRLSHMLSPIYNLLFRNLREIRLSTALRVSASSQRSMFWSFRE